MDVQSQRQTQSRGQFEVAATLTACLLLTSPGKSKGERAVALEQGGQGVGAGCPKVSWRMTDRTSPAQAAVV